MDLAPTTWPLQDWQSCPSTVDATEPGLAQTTLVAPAPFAWPNGDQLLLLDVEAGGWVVAELQFVPDECRYIEVRCVAYQWQREAIGALLSRALAAGDDALIDTVEQLDAYMDRHYGIALINC